MKRCRVLILTFAIVFVLMGSTMATPVNELSPGFTVTTQVQRDLYSYIETEFEAEKPNNVSLPLWEGIRMARLEYKHRLYREPFYNDRLGDLADIAEQVVKDRQSTDLECTVFLEKESLSGCTVYWWKTTLQKGGLGPQESEVVYEVWLVADEKMQTLDIKMFDVHASRGQIREWLDMMVARTPR